MKNTAKIAGLPLIAVFLLVIYAVPVTQAALELSRGGRIQALDLVVDAFAAPLRSASARHADADKFSDYLDSLSGLLSSAGGPETNLDRAESLAEELLFTAEDLKKKVIAKNRHVRADSSSPAVARLDALRLQCSNLLSSLKNGTAAAAADLCAAVRQGGKELEREYRRPSPMDAPVLVVKDLRYIFWNDRYLRPYEKEMENSSVFAQAIRPRMFLAHFFLFKDLGEKGVLGRKGWFFYKQDIDYLVKPSVLDRRSIVVDPNEWPLGGNPLSAIRNFRDQLMVRGIDLLFVVVPGKPSIYPDVVSSRMQPASAGSFSHSLRVLDELKNAGVEVVDLFAPFARERLSDHEAGDSLYLHEDTHWKARAVRLAARVIADRVRRYPWFQAGSTEYALDSVTIERTGDIGTMSSLPLDKVRGVYGLFMPEKTTCYKVFRVSRDPRGAETGRVPYKDEFRASAILVLGDSFSRIYQTDEPRSAGWISHLAFELAQPVASLVNDGGASTLVRQSLARKPNLLKGKKLVIWEIVERDFRYGEEGWKNVQIAGNKE
ncbi:MAG: hypothetical protein JXA71_03730 [Chitinispirillaceae bacterium]|nr:hypothetical protein [Chitinispirillaceae bacterium]